MAKAIHMMVRVRDLDASINFYTRAMDLAVADRFDFDGFSLVYLSNAETGFELELTWNENQDGAYQHGNGYGHLAFSVTDLEAEHKRFVDEGFAPKDIKELAHGGKHLARFFFVEDPDGYKIEMLERQGRYQ